MVVGKVEDFRNFVRISTSQGDSDNFYVKYSERRKLGMDYLECR